MSKHFYFIDGNVAAGQSTLDAITNESATFGIGATSILEPNELVVFPLPLWESGQPSSHWLDRGPLHPL
jgi:hypothetical protein